MDGQNQAVVRNEAHQKLVDDILYSIGSQKQFRIWPRSVGFDQSRNIKYGIPGESDIDGIAMGGRRISIEVKTGTGKLSESQKRWKKMILTYGGIYVEARSVEDVQHVLHLPFNQEIGK